MTNDPFLPRRRRVHQHHQLLFVCGSLLGLGIPLTFACIEPVGSDCVVECMTDDCRALDGAAPATDASGKATLPSLGDDDDVHGQPGDSREYALDDGRDEVHRGRYNYSVVGSLTPRTCLTKGPGAMIWSLG